VELVDGQSVAAGARPSELYITSGQPRRRGGLWVPTMLSQPLTWCSPTGPWRRSSASGCRSVQQSGTVDTVTLEYSIAWLICAFLRGREAMMVG
jgi:hypothetical protein